MLEYASILVYSKSHGNDTNPLLVKCLIEVVLIIVSGL